MFPFLYWKLLLKQIQNEIYSPFLRISGKFNISNYKNSVISAYH